MKPSVCACGERAEYSVCVLISILGVRPRRQKCGRAQLFCASCMQRIMILQDRKSAVGVQQSLRSAYTAITEHCQAASHSPPPTLNAEKHSATIEQKEQTEQFRFVTFAPNRV